MSGLTMEQWLATCEKMVREEMAGREIVLPSGEVFVCPSEQWFELRLPTLPAPDFHDDAPDPYRSERSDGDLDPFGTPLKPGT